MSDILSIQVGTVWRKAGMVAKASGGPITAGTVNYYLKALTGDNAGKWWKDSDQTWAETETANAMTHQADGNWTIELTSSPFAADVIYVEYVKESGDLHVAGEGRLLRGAATAVTTAGIWSYASRTLTQSATAVASVVSGSTITLHRGDTFTASITGLGSIAGRLMLWFTAKAGARAADAAALIQIEETAGLIYANRAAVDSSDTSDGAIIVTDEDAGDLTITLTADQAADLEQETDGVYDIQWMNASGKIATLTAGKFVVTADVTRATS